MPPSETTPPHLIVPYTGKKSVEYATLAQVKSGLEVRLSFTLPLAETAIFQKSHPEEVTASEIRVLMHLADGFTPKDGAVHVGISERSIHLGLQKLRKKLGASTNEQMIAKAFRLGLIE